MCLFDEVCSSILKAKMKKKLVLTHVIDPKLPTGEVLTLNNQGVGNF